MRCIDNFVNENKEQEDVCQRWDLAPLFVEGNYDFQVAERVLKKDEVASYVDRDYLKQTSLRTNINTGGDRKFSCTLHFIWKKIKTLLNTVV